MPLPGLEEPMVAPEVSAVLYRGVREQVSTAVRDLAEEDLAAVVPGCPLWTARDLLSHQAGVARDFVEGRLDGAPSPAWTAVHVDTRKDRSVAEILDEWEEYGTQLEDLVRAGSRKGRLLNNPYVDAGVHCADLSAVVPVGRPDREVWLAALDFCLGNCKGDEPGSLRVVTEDAGYEIGEGEPASEAKADSYELFRAVYGRRSADQIAAWGWSGEPGAWLQELARLPQTSVDQRD
jgi:uncharacterized protein (TIGR03083 family)